MATYIFNDISDVKKHIGGAVNRSIEMESIAPSVLSAFENHIEIWLSTAMWDTLILHIATPSGEETKLLNKLKRPMAMLTMFEYMSIGGIQISESGFFRKDGEDFKQAYKYQENEYKSKMINQGYEAIEKMLIFLEANEADYADWKNSEAYKRNKALFINYASELRDMYSKYISRYTFEILRPLIEDLEIFTIQPLIGDSQFKELKDNILLKALSNDEKILLRLIQKVVANFAIEDGLKRFWIRIDGNKVIQNEKLDNQSYEKNVVATIQEVNVAVNHNNEYANRHVSNLMKYLTENIDLFPLYKTYQEARDAETAVVIDERCECTCGTCSSCTGITNPTNKRRGIVNF